jgi:hypothetical protein
MRFGFIPARTAQEQGDERALEQQIEQEADRPQGQDGKDIVHMSAASQWRAVAASK